MRAAWVVLALLIVATFSIMVASPVKPPRERLTVATTTSLYDTGFLDVVEKHFEERHPNYDLVFISAGTGIAIQYACRGDADAILVHAPSEEAKFLMEGYGVNRRIIFYNFFLIVGPCSDPAEIKGLGVVEALARIVEAGREGEVLWISRGDGSGTHFKEMQLWRQAGFNPDRLRDEAWYLESGAGMGKTLLLAEEENAYTLSDKGTYLKYRGDGLISLEALVSRSKELLNVYSVVAVNPEKVEKVNFKAAMDFIGFLTSEEGQGLLASYGEEKYGEPLFHPAVKLLQNPEGQIAQWIAEYAYMEGEECPSSYRMERP